MDVDDRLANIPPKATEWVKRHGDRKGQHLVRQLGRSNVAGVPMKRKMNGIGQQQKSYSETKLPQYDNTNRTYHVPRRLGEYTREERMAFKKL